MRKLLVFVFFVMIASQAVFGWSDGHVAITKAAFDVLSESQKEIWQQNVYDPTWDVNAVISEQLINKYSYYPDCHEGPYDKFHGNTLLRKRSISFFIYAEDGGNYVHAVPYWQNAPERPWVYHYFSWEGKENFERSLRGAKWYFQRSVDVLRRGSALEAAEYLGSFAHAIEDRGSPYHCMDGLKEQRNKLWPDSTAPGKGFAFFALSDKKVTADIEGYRPAVLGKTVDEAALEFARRFEQMTKDNRGMLAELVEVHKADDWEKRVSGPKSDQIQSLMAANCAKLVADVFHTAFVLADRR